MATEQKDSNNPGDEQSKKLFERGTNASDRSVDDTTAGMSDAQRGRTLARLEQQAAQRQAAKPAGNAAEAARQGERSRPAWTTKLIGAKKKGKLVKRRIKRWIIGSIIVGILSVVGPIFSFLPNRLDVLREQMEDKFYSRLEKYVEARSSKMFFRYLSIYVFGNNNAIRSCQKAGQTSFTVHSDCFYREKRADWPKTRLGQAYRSWKENRLEAKVLTDIRVHYAPNGLKPDGTRGPTWVVTLPDGDVPIDPDNPDAGMQRAFTTVDVTDSSRRTSTELYKKIMNNLKTETRAGIITKMRASIHLKNKYGLTRCIFFCDLRDRIDTRKVDIKKAWQGVLSDRVIGAANARAGLFMSCMFQGKQTCTEDNKEFRTQYQDTINKLKAKHGDQKIENLIKLADEYSTFRANGGNLTKFITNKILEKIASKLAVGSASSIINAIPIVGQIIYGIIVGYEVLTIVLIIYNIYTFINSPSAQYASTVVKSGVYTAAYATMGTANDESRAADGDVFDIDVRAAQTQSLDGMEKSFLWNAEIGSPDGFANFGATFAKAAYAAETDPTKEYPYVCDSDGARMEIDQVVCPNWRFDTPNRVREFAKSLPGSATAEALANSQAASAVQEVANDIVSTIDAPFEAATAFAYDKATPQNIKDWLNNNIEPFARKAANYMFSIPFEKAQIAGAQLWDAWRLGVDWTVNDMLRGGIEEDGKQFGLGARVATPQEVEAMDSAYNQERATKFANMNLWDKMFSTQHESTFVNQLALAVPTNVTQSLKVVSPATAFGLISSMLRGDAAHALAPGAVHAGIPQYVFGDEIDRASFRTEDQEVTCPVDRADAEGNMKGPGDPGTVDRGLGRIEYTTSNVCLLDEFVIGTGSDFYNDEPLDPAVSDASYASQPGTGGDGVSTGQFAWPIAANDFDKITSCYGPRGGRMHYGLDITGKLGEGRTQILASDGGEVVRVAYDADGAGHYAVLKHANSFYTLYMHMPSRAAIRVKVGDKVSKGQVIGVEGNSGGSSGPHLHFTIAKGEPRDSAGINPLIELRKSTPANSVYLRPENNPKGC